MKVNGEAIYGTRPIAPYRQGQIVFTQKGRRVYAIYLTPKDGDGLPSQVLLPALRPKPGSKVYLLGAKKPVEWEPGPDGATQLKLSPSASQAPPCRHAFVFRFTP